MDVFLQPDILKTWRIVNLTFCKPDVSDVLKPDVLKPEVLKHDVLWVYQRSSGRNRGPTRPEQDQMGLVRWRALLQGRWSLPMPLLRLWLLQGHDSARLILCRFPLSRLQCWQLESPLDRRRQQQFQPPWWSERTTGGLLWQRGRGDPQAVPHPAGSARHAGVPAWRSSGRRGASPSPAGRTPAWRAGAGWASSRPWAPSSLACQISHSKKAGGCSTACSWRTRTGRPRAGRPRPRSPGRLSQQGELTLSNICWSSVILCRQNLDSTYVNQALGLNVQNGGSFISHCRGCLGSSSSRGMLAGSTSAMLCS